MAHASDASPEARVSFDCPRCRKTVYLPSLKTPPAKPDVQIPKTLGGMLFGLVAGVMGEPVVDAGNETLACPHCTASFPCREVENLQGELLLACPHCPHMQLSKPLEASAIVTCDSCKRGFTAGIAAKSKGTLKGQRALPDDCSTAPSTSLIARYQCVQVTHTFEYGSGKNEVGQHPVTQDRSLRLVDPETATARVEHGCPFCGTKLTFQVRSLDAADRSAAATQRIANVTVWSLLAVPLTGLFFGVRYLLGAYADDVVSPLDLGVGAGAAVFTLIGLVSLSLRSNTYRQQALLPASRVTLTADALSQPLWQTTGMYTKGARLEVSHKVLTVESSAIGGTGGSPTVADRTSPA